MRRPQASINNKEAIIKAAKESVDSVMLCSEPFAVAYGLDWLEDVLVIDIGAGTVDLCRMHGTMPEDTDQVTLNTAGDFVDEQLSALLKESRPEAQFSIQMIKEIKERYASVSEEMERVKVFLPVNGKPTEFDITDEMREACRRMIPPIVEGLGQLIATFDPEFQDRLKNRVLLAGGGSMIKGLDTAIEALHAAGARRWQGAAHRRADLRRLERRAQDRPRHAGGVLGEAEVARGARARPIAGRSKTGQKGRARERVRPFSCPGGSPERVPEPRSLSSSACVR